MRMLAKERDLEMGINFIQDIFYFMKNIFGISTCNIFVALKRELGGGDPVAINFWCEVYTSTE